MTPNQQQLIEDYHAGRLDADQAQAFESELASNPDMQMESDLQADIISGLKEFRKQELKSRLDAIPVSGGWMQAAQHSAMIKVVGGIVVAALVGTGAYYLTAEEEAPQGSQKEIRINAPADAMEEYEWKLGKETEVAESVQLDQLKGGSEAGTPFDPLEQSEAVSDLSQNEEDEVSKKEGRSFAPNFSVPATVDVASEEGFVSEDPGSLPDANIADSNTPIDVKSAQTNDVLKYKYYDGKLFLSGDFERSPYEILEINRAEGRSIFVFYQNNFYSVGLSDRLVVLPMVKDPTLIHELEILQQNK